MSDKLVRFGFISESIPPLDDPVIRNIETVALKRNKELEITGVLYIYRETNLETFEGLKKNIDILMKSVYKDPRHKNITLLHEMEIESRLYPDDNIKIIRVNDEDIEMVSRILDLREKHL